MQPGTISKAESIIEALKPAFSTNRLQFDMLCSSYLTGKENNAIRQAIIYIITSEVRPATKAGLLQCSDVLTKYFTQSKLF